MVTAILQPIHRRCVISLAAPQEGPPRHTNTSVVSRDALEERRPPGGGRLARGHGFGLFAVGGAYWPLATAHSDPSWVRTCFGGVNGAPG